MVECQNNYIQHYQNFELVITVITLLIEMDFI